SKLTEENVAQQPLAKRVSNSPVTAKVRDLWSKKEALIEGDKGAGEFVYDGEVLMPRQSRVMRFAIIFSIVFHALLLLVRFADPVAFNSLLQTSSLEVLLINATSQDAPTEAKFVAPKDFAGGGEAVEENIVPTSPDDYSPQASLGDSWEDTIKQQNQVREQTARELTSIKESFSLMPPIDPSWGTNDPRRVAEEERRRLLSDKIAAIEQKIREESSRPRRMYIGPAARSHIQAVYYDSIRKKIELKGTESFPLHNGMPLYGSLLMEVSVNPDGTLAKAVILESSGNAILDRQAQAIAGSAQPFPPAPAELLRVERNVEIVFIMRFKFMNDGRVETELRERVNPSSRR
ncbi:MAG: energy transducer TonB family protein, partial [Saezia sp.]